MGKATKTNTDVPITPNPNNTSADYDADHLDGIDTSFQPSDEERIEILEIKLLAAEDTIQTLSTRYNEHVSQPNTEKGKSMVEALFSHMKVNDNRYQTICKLFEAADGRLDDLESKLHKAEYTKDQEQGLEYSHRGNILRELRKLEQTVKDNDQYLRKCIDVIRMHIEGIEE